MAGSEVRAGKLMWFAAGAASMAIYLLGPHALIDQAYDLGYSASEWVRTR
ncbi:hypothetical protein [Sphingomonas sp.]|jgi:hypothetical protein